MSDAKTKFVGGEDAPIPGIDSALVDANTLIEGNRLVWTRIDTGYATNSTYAIANPTNVRCVGLCEEHADNTTGNAFGNSGSAGGARVRFRRGIALLNGDGTVSAANYWMPVFLISDVAGTNNGLTTIGLAAGPAYPFVGYVTTYIRGTTEKPDASKIPVSVGNTPFPGVQPAMLSQGYANDPTVHTAAFTVSVGFMHKINPSGATFAYTFPAISSANDGMQIGIVNVSTGSTATVAAPSGSDNIGNSAGTSTGATAAGPTGGNVKTYTADNTQKAWIVGL